MSTATAAHDDAAYELVPDDLAPGTARPRVLLVGTGLAAAGIIVYFAALVGMYLRVRHGVLAGPEIEPGVAPVWFADGQTIPLTPANMAFGTMVLSCLTMQWAVDSVKRDDQRSAFFALAMTVLFGGAVINATSFLYTQSGFSLSGGSNPAGLLFYAVTGSHLALIVGALLFAMIMTVRTIGGGYGSHDREGLVAASLIWYLTTGIMAVIWYAVYVTK